jgi:hypothetical protein
MVLLNVGLRDFKVSNANLLMHSMHPTSLCQQNLGTQAFLKGKIFKYMYSSL